jgi:hypothetical protein
MSGTGCNADAPGYAPGAGGARPRGAAAGARVSGACPRWSRAVKTRSGLTTLTNCKDASINVKQWNGGLTKYVGAPTQFGGPDEHL